MMIRISSRDIRIVCRRIRDASKSTRQQLAASAGVSDATIARFERVGIHVLRVHDYCLETLAAISRSVLGKNGYRLERRLSASGATEGSMLRLNHGKTINKRMQRRKGGERGKIRR